MTQNLNTPKTHTIIMVETNTSKDITVLEKTVQRLARELGIVLKETKYSGISYVKEIEGENNIHSICYFKDHNGCYENITIENQNNQLRIANCENEYLINITSFGKNLYQGAKKPRITSVEHKIDSAILTQNKIRKEPEKKHELNIEINEEDLGSISRKTIEKYI